MIKTEARNINGREWSVTQWSGTKALDAVYTVGKLLGNGLSGVQMGNNGRFSLDSQIDVGGLLSGVLDGLGSSAEAQKTIYRLLGSTRIDGVDVNANSFDGLFAGNQIFDLLPGLQFVLEANFGDFLTSALGATTSESGAETSNAAPTT